MLKSKVFNDILALQWRPTGLCVMLENQENFTVGHEPEDRTNKLKTCHVLSSDH